MTITTTAIGFLLSSLGLALCGTKFFKAFRNVGGSRVGGKSGVLLSFLYLGFASVTGILGIGVLFFARNPEILYSSLLIAHSFLTATTVIGVYLIFYILRPLASPLPGMTFALSLGIAEIATLVRDHPHPVLDAAGGVDWGFSRLLSILLAYLLFLGIGSFFVVFTHSFLQTKSRAVRAVSFIMAALAVLGVLSASIWLLLPSDIVFRAFIQSRIFDITLGFIGTVLLGVFLVPQKMTGWVLKILGLRSKHSSILFLKNDFLKTFDRKITSV